MRHVVTWGKTQMKVTLPDAVPDGVIFPLDVDGRRYQAVWQRALGLLILKDEAGVESHARVRCRQTQRFDGDAETQVLAELAQGARVSPVAATVAYDMPGQNSRVKVAHDLVVRSQITGKVLKVLVKTGEDVQPGQALLTIEAMKMENRVFASQGGKVLAVAVKDGDAVQTGKELLRIKP